MDSYEMRVVFNRQRDGAAFTQGKAHITAPMRIAAKDSARVVMEMQRRRPGNTGRQAPDGRASQLGLRPATVRGCAWA